MFPPLNLYSALKAKPHPQCSSKKNKQVNTVMGKVDKINKKLEKEEKIFPDIKKKGRRSQSGLA